MNDYMTALLERFEIPSPQAAAMEAKVDAAVDELREHLGKEQRRILLRLLDLENVRRVEAKLYGFLSGYRLAEGIHRELDEQPRFSIAAEDEARASVQYYYKEWGEQDGEAQSER